MSAGGTAIQLVTSYEPVRLTGGTVIAVPEQGPLAGRGVIERMKTIGICVDEVAEEISVRPSLRSEATALAIAAGAPVLLVERSHLASSWRSRPVTSSPPPRASGSGIGSRFSLDA
jgi:hypothetical protein